MKKYRRSGQTTLQIGFLPSAFKMEIVIKTSFCATMPTTRFNIAPKKHVEYSS